jgi:ABC-2 type transport system permease protein
VVWGLLVKSTQAAEAFSFFVLFLPYLSDGFVPAETMPRLLRGFAEHQPITPLVETVRALLLDQPIGNAGWIAAAWLAIGVAISIPIAAVLFRRRTTWAASRT